MYVALCYCKLDYYDVSLEILGVYLNAFPDSSIAVNLKVGDGWRGHSAVGWGSYCGPLLLLRRGNGRGRGQTGR